MSKFAVGDRIIYECFVGGVNEGIVESVGDDAGVVYFGVWSDSRYEISTYGALPNEIRHRLPDPFDQRFRARPRGFVYERWHPRYETFRGVMGTANL